ncbi:unnamed protein product [Ilex paraguariensis]|uniref:Pectinesterase inhibitor domain-containing protein n=1 Tax=Ilex paraguariensis TaxID=185542 RepID=A0ABC8TS23_9AQUA
MARFDLAFSSLTLSLLYIAGTAIATTTTSIEEACKATRYPAVCVETLQAHATDPQPSLQALAETTLSAGIAKIKQAKTFVSQMTNGKGLSANEHAALKDCFDGMGDGLDQLTQSVPELRKMGQDQGGDFLWHKSNVQTWVSAALTNYSDCYEDSDEPTALNGSIKSAIRGHVEPAAQVISNALALVNQLQQGH